MFVGDIIILRVGGHGQEPKGDLHVLQIGIHGATGLLPPVNVRLPLPEGEFLLQVICGSYRGRGERRVISKAGLDVCSADR